jgi:hypothetical protein
MAFAIPSSSNRTDRFPVYGFRLAYPIAGDGFLHRFRFSAVIPPSSYTHQMAFLPTFFGSYLSGILLSDWCYHAVHLNSIQTRTPSLGQVFSSQSRPLHPSMQVLCIIGLTFIATMDSSDFS